MDTLGPFIKEQLSLWQVPGCAVAVVQDGKVTLTSGWGQRDVDQNLPVTADTLFAMGSVTKAFTASAAGALVDDGLLDWEQPLRDYVPGIQLNDAPTTDRLTIVDLLSHRSGLPRHEMVWVGHPDRSRAEVVRRLRFLPLSRDLRQAFQYSNLGYLAAGHAVEALAGTSWESCVQDRLLTPLGMSRSDLSVEAMNADPDHATAYERRDGKVVPVPARPITALAPAGALNSSAADMARWLQAQLNTNIPNGRAVISPATVARQHLPHIVLPEDHTFPESTRHAYGLGWMIGHYRDHRLLEHGGAIDGFQSACVLLPDDGIGVAVMTNTSANALAMVVAYRVLDELLGLEPLDWSGRLKARVDAALGGMAEARGARRVVPDAPLPRPLDAYAGEYEHPGYGVLTITAEGDRLRPHFGTMDLSMQHRHFETFDLQWHELGGQLPDYPLMFVSDPDGDITALTVPFEPTTGPLRFDRRPDERARDPEVLRRLTGTYAMGPIELTVALSSKNTLTATLPGAPPFELEPGRGLRFGVAGQPALTAEFELDAAGSVTRLAVQPVGIFLPRP